MELGAENSCAGLDIPYGKGVPNSNLQGHHSTAFLLLTKIRFCSITS